MFIKRKSFFNEYCIRAGWNINNSHLSGWWTSLRKAEEFVAFNVFRAWEYIIRELFLSHHSQALYSPVIDIPHVVPDEQCA